MGPRFFSCIGSKGRAHALLIRVIGGIIHAFAIFIIKTGPLIIKNLDILSKQNHLLSKIEIYYQKGEYTVHYTWWCIDGSKYDLIRSLRYVNDMSYRKSVTNFVQK
jgi:hypothetical protein